MNGLCPIYGIANNIDNLNYSDKTLWNESKKNGYFYFNKIKLGEQFIGEASDIEEIFNNKYDFICSSHFIQHCANPIKVLKGIKNLLKDDGCLLFIVPYSINTFDNKRKITELKHMIDDYNMDIREDDKTHMEEIMKNHNMIRDAGVIDYDLFIKRCNNNHQIRGCHHHVFNEYNFYELLDYVKLKVVKVELWYPFHMVFICTKTGNNNFEKLNINEIKNLKINGSFYLKPNYPLK